MRSTRILGAGLVAGAILTASQLLSSLTFAPYFTAELERLGISHAVWEMPVFLAVYMLFGTVLAWLYAALRPQYGAGPHAALRAAAVVWCLVLVTWAVTNLLFGYAPILIAVGMLWGVIELSVAALVAGWIIELPRAAHAVPPGATPRH